MFLRSLTTVKVILPKFFALLRVARFQFLSVNFCIIRQYRKMKFEYPVARRDETAFDEYHGVKIPDPYRWLEDPDSEETKEFVRVQNDLSQPFLESCQHRKKVMKRVTELWNYPKYGCPFKEGNFYYYFMNTGLQNQSVLYQQDSLDGKPEVFLDPNALSKDGLVSLSLYNFSENGEYLAYGISESGSDWIKIKIKRVCDREDLPEVIHKVKFSDASWTHDNKGFFYARYPDVDKSVDGHETTRLQNQSLYYHRLGTSEMEDVLCAHFPEHPGWLIGACVSKCGNYVILEVSETCKGNMVFYCDLTKLPDGITGLLPLKCIIDNFESEYRYVDNIESLFTILTDKDAPLYRLVLIDFESPSQENWKDLISEHSKNVLDWAEVVHLDKLLVCYTEDVKNVLKLFDSFTGECLETFTLDVGTIASSSCKKSLSEVFFLFTSFLTPGIIYHFDLKNSTELNEFRRTDVADFDPTKFETTQVFYPSKDGTKIPMYIIHEKGLVRDGSAPVFLYGYGGFNISLLPGFNISRIIFMRHYGGVAAIPNLRGGAEYGEKWHSDGKVLKKQNVFDDFHAAAEYLISNKYTSPNKVAINGASNGGLLIGACINQRPELYGSAIAQVGVMDMLKFHKFTIGSAWACDYGSSDNEEEFHYLLKYSPLHNIRIPTSSEVQYPPVLLMTGDHDDRVVPLHSLKFIAQLQHIFRDCQKQKNPLLIRIDVQSGHGRGKPTTKRIEELTDVYCFMSNTMHLEYRD